MRSAATWAVLLFVSIGVSAATAAGDGMTREQGDAILNELRQIRTLLEQPRRFAPAPQFAPPPGAAAGGKVTLKIGGDPWLGRPDAPVTIVEYTDYQCTFCSRFHAATFPEIRKNFIDTGQARFIKRDLPLDVHPNALKAAQAARCAGDQGRFWEMHDLLSADPSSLGAEVYAAYARDLSLDAGAFRSCIDGERHLDGIRANVQGAAAAGIRSTPVFVVGTVRGDTLEGTMIVGAQPYAIFEKAIADSLAAKP